ncbi:ATP-binding protein [Prosthecodimorpha staleyi]|uniref:ATP-binding protein n=1 Tax=Prosthecodimorpha staleyi TaxID=2840188 RepID=A0A947GE47_9HYPH|nr:ATP-binding protein [Prosthecodimorpha staleyi]MBT9293313.1 ATP-binding protein [Prosthecodimorpha staleyi]
MDFIVVNDSKMVPLNASNVAYLCEDNWNDWFIYKTLYFLIVFDYWGRKFEIGQVKIGEFNWHENQSRPNIPRNFSKLPERFFSLGQDIDYYNSLVMLNNYEKDEILTALRDVIHSNDIYKLAEKEEVMTRSLLRDQDQRKILIQFPKILKGEADRTSFAFKFKAPHGSTTMASGLNRNALELEFSVSPYTYPPSNIHVIIGRNGVGKTRILKCMSRSLVDTATTVERDGLFTAGSAAVWPFDIGADFANLVSVSFSAFDENWVIDNIKEGRSAKIRYENIGLPSIDVPIQRTRDSDYIFNINRDSQLANEFAESAANCIFGLRGKRWEHALATLETDNLFSDIGISDLFNTKDIEDMKRRAKEIYRNLSSGHKIVLLAITRLIQTVEERTLVLIDEPEAHLPPPLLAAFLRALSDLLINRNGVAIIATHSPVVVQEVPRSCVWKIIRSGLLSKAERPEIETFAESVSTLTREVFGLEVDRSGFHKMISDVVENSNSFEEVMEKFDYAVGSQGQALIRAMMVQKLKGSGK